MLQFLIFSYYYDFLLFNWFSDLSITRNLKKTGIFSILVMGRIHVVYNMRPSKLYSCMGQESKSHSAHEKKRGGLIPPRPKPVCAIH